MSGDLQPRPRKALILAAGLGTRLRPLTWRKPKPMLTIWGVPLLDHAIRLLRGMGVEEFAVNTHWRGELISRHIESGAFEGEIRVSREKRILGTGGALLPLRGFFGEEEAFWIFNADVAASVRPEPLLRAHAAGDPVATLWMTDQAGPRTVEVDEDSSVVCFRSRNPGGPGTLTFSGLHLVAGRIYRYLPREGFASIIDAYEEAMRSGESVKGVEAPGSFWADCGTPEDLLRAHRDVCERSLGKLPGGELYRPETDIGGMVCAGRGAVVGKGARLANCLIGERTAVGTGVKLEGCIVGDDVRVEADAANSVLVSAADIEDLRLAEVVGDLGGDPGRTAVRALSARGSDREFYRVNIGSKWVMACLYGGLRRENALYAGHSAALRRAGIPVPRLLAENGRSGWLALEDLGGDDLLGRVKNAPAANIGGLYREALETVVTLHKRGAKAMEGREMEPAFGTELYRWEHELFAEHFMRRRLGKPEPEIRRIIEELGAFSAPLAESHAVTVHRDLQSTNIIFADDRAHLIDYQGMRMGPPAYDLASLLCDPYAELPADLRSALLKDYAERVPWGEETIRLFPVAAVQRLVQAIGAYARLAQLPGTGYFAGYILPAARIILEESQATEEPRHLRELLENIMR